MLDRLPILPALNDQLTRGLCCAALNAGLGSVMIFDLLPDQLPAIASNFAQMIAVASGQKVHTILLNSGESEDRLWGSYGISGRSANAPLVWQPGLLAPAEDDSIHLIAIPDLERISPTLARALVTMIGADVAQLERYGTHRQWLPKFYWLAGCPGQGAGRISLHLLDRFALRLQTHRQRRPSSTALLSWLNLPDDANTTTDAILPAQLIQQINSAAQIWPRMTDAALDRVLEYEVGFSNASPRRSFALGRLGHTLARLAAANEVTDEHIDDAARLIGLAAPINESRKAQPSTESKTSNEADAKLPVSPEEQVSTGRSITNPSVEPELSAGQQVQSTPVEQTALSSPETELPAAPLAAPLDPYREDHQPVERESASLRLPFQHSRQTATTRGTIIGTQPARTLHDLALVNTLFESAKFQFIRRQSIRAGGQSDAENERRLLIAPSDLRGYRRAPMPEQLLILVLDYTCLADRQWLDPLLPYFKEAYVNRAKICLIQVGATTTDGQFLRAERRFFNSVLVPGLAAALDAPAGKATPLAHGLELALQTLKHALQHGRQIAHGARLVVISDGRGNVPLSASILGRVENRVGREGIEDALQTARKLRALDRVDISFFDPQPASHAGLVSDLAEALGVIPRQIPLTEPDWPAETAAEFDVVEKV